MKKTILLSLLLMSGTCYGLYAQVDTIGVYRLTDGGGDPLIKSATTVAKDLIFTDYSRMGVTPSSGSGFFVSKGFPYGEADYDSSKIHTFTVTPQNGATVYIKKFSMSHKRSGSNPNPGNTVQFKCVVIYDNKEYDVGAGTTLNPTAWFHADNLKIVSRGPVTFKLYAKNMYDPEQSWMQRNVSLIGASIPEGIEVEEVVGPLEPTYTEVAKDYINRLTFFELDAEGALIPTSTYDMGGMPLTYTFVVGAEAELTNLKFHYTLPTGTTLLGTMPSNFASERKQSITLHSSWGERKAYLVVKQLLPTENSTILTFNTLTNPTTWNNNTKGWVSHNVSVNTNGVTQFAHEGAVLVLAAKEVMRSVEFDLSLATLGAFTGIFSVEASTDGVEWEYVKHYNACQQIPSTSERVREQLPQESRFVRFIYDCMNNQAILVNNISAAQPTSATEAKSGKIKLTPNPTRDKVKVEGNAQFSHISIYSLNGILAKTLSGDVSTIDVSNLVAGIYYVWAVSEGGETYTNRLIIQE